MLGDIMIWLSIIFVFGFCFNMMCAMISGKSDISEEEWELFVNEQSRKTQKQDKI